MILNHIRYTYKKRLLLPVAAFILLLYPASRLSPKEYLIPFALPGESSLDASLEDGHTFLSIPGLTLHYTGYDYLQSGTIEGHIYYSLEAGRCRFYIIDKSYQHPLESQYRDYTFTGRIIYEEELLLTLTEAVAKELGWTAEGVRQVSAPYILSAVDLFPLNQIACLAFMLLVCAAIFIDFTWSLFYCLFPGRISGLKQLRRQRNLKKELRTIEIDMQEGYQKENFYLTETHLVFLLGTNTAVIPIADIRWIYIQNHLRKWFLLQASMSSILHIVTADGKQFQCNLGESNEYGVIKAHLKNRKPDIIFGYSKTHKRLVKQLAKR